MTDHLAVEDQQRPWLFGQALALTRRWLAEQVDYHDDTFPGLLVKQKARQATPEH